MKKCAAISTFIHQKKAENNKQINIQKRWTDCVVSVDRQNDKLIKYNTTKHSIKTYKNPQPIAHIISTVCNLYISSCNILACFNFYIILLKRNENLLIFKFAIFSRAIPESTGVAFAAPGRLRLSVELRSSVVLLRSQSPLQCSMARVR